ncbi:Ap4A phosphorylase-like protein II [Xylogone sp. PMI_703]|nr:Ap4A phosphorylase-like protein II [Xylogone sp. PMI_703]
MFRASSTISLSSLKFTRVMAKLPKDLPNLVREKFYKAKEDSSLTYYPTQVSILRFDTLANNTFDIQETQFQIRYSPVLAQKPKATKPDGPQKPLNPFLNPPPSLYVTEVPPAHYVVLNKFAIVPEHFILATKEFKLQTDLLEEDDLGAAYTCLATYRAEGKELFGFFNSGEHSGASQPHRHIQFLPVDSMYEGLKADEWKPLIDRLTTEPKPAPIPKDATSDMIHRIYLKMHEQARHAMQQYLTSHSEGDLNEAVDGSPPMSYNLGFTDTTLVLCPRIAEGIKIPSETGESLGPVALNGTLLAGTLLVKSDAEWNALKNDEAKLKDILTAIGISQNHSVQQSS